MSSIDFIQVRIQPHYTAKPDRVIHEAKITVKVSGKEEYSKMVIMDDNDFQSRFDWMLDEIRREVKDAFSS